MSTVKSITSLSQLDEILEKSEGKLTVIDFYAKWCGPCREVAPKYAALAKQHGKTVNFLECDVDDGEEVAERYQILTLPTFVFVKGGKKVDRVRRADATARLALEAAILKHSQPDNLPDAPPEVFTKEKAQTDVAGGYVGVHGPLGLRITVLFGLVGSCALFLLVGLVG